MSTQLTFVCIVFLFCLGCFSKNNDTDSMTLSKAIKKSAKSFVRSVVRLKKSQALHEYKNNKKVSHFKGSLTIEIINGTVDITGTSQQACTINEHIFSYKPKKESSLTFIKNDKITINNDDNDYITDYAITVPMGTKINVITTNGMCKISNITKEIHTKTTNGSVKLYNITSTSTAEVVNGSITAYISSNDFANADYSSVNGSIKVTTPPLQNVSLKAHTTHGAISTNFSAKPTHNFVASSLDQTIGKGNNRISCLTVNGSIIIRQQA